MDGIIDTVSADHPLVPLISLLKPNGKLVLLGAPTKPHEVPAFPLLLGMNLFFLFLLKGNIPFFITFNVICYILVHFAFFPNAYNIQVDFYGLTLNLKSKVYIFF